MRKDYLLMIVDRLKSVKPERFDLGNWAGSNLIPWQGRDDLSCGTIACAIGWATTIPEFRAAGFCLKKHSWLENQAEIHYQHNGEDLKEFDAVAAFLDIDNRDAEYLFHPDEYIDQYGDELEITGLEGIENVIYRIQEFIKEDNR